MYPPHDGFEGDMDPDPTYGGSTSYSDGSTYTPHPPSFRYSFNTEEELITSDVFQRCLGQSLAFKDHEIMRLRSELLALM